MPNVGSHLVERELWEAVQERFAENKARASRNRKTDYLFTGRMKCDACKGAYIDCHGERGYERRFYTCRGRSRVVDQCSMPVFRERDIDAEVWPWIKEIATHFERVEATLAQRQADADEQNTRVNALIANTDRLIVQKKEEQALVLGLFKSTSCRKTAGRSRMPYVSGKSSPIKPTAKSSSPKWSNLTTCLNIWQMCGMLAGGFQKV